MHEVSWLPAPTEETRPFFEGAAAGYLRLQVCEDCGCWHFPLVRMCSDCGSTNLRWRDACGRGTLYAHGRLHRSYHPRHEDRLPLTLAQVDTVEGVRILTNLVGDLTETARVGDQVEVAFETTPHGGVLPAFKLIRISK